MAKMRAIDAAVRILEKEGISTAFGVPGAAINPLYSALKKRGLAGKILVTGQDAGLEALQNIAEGKQTMTMYKPIIPLANAAVDAAIKLAKKQPLDNAVSFHNDAIDKDIRAILLEVVVVDKGNLMDTVIKDGYAKYEDVYKNVPEADRPKKQ